VAAAELGRRSWSCDRNPAAVGTTLARLEAAAERCRPRRTKQVAMW